MKYSIVLTLCLVIPHLSCSNTPDGATASPYASQLHQTVPSLDPAELESYLTGAGMGLARAAELNGYPGPRHVLELADALGLTAVQRAQTQAVFEAMQAEAVRLGEAVVDQERALNTLFAEGNPDAAQIEAAVASISRLQGALRLTHLNAHLEMKLLLTDEQMRRYDDLRGYSDPKEPPHHGLHGS